MFFKKVMARSPRAESSCTIEEESLDSTDREVRSWRRRDNDGDDDDLPMELIAVVIPL
jgi:hypothetical protein